MAPGQAAVELERIVQGISVVDPRYAIKYPQYGLSEALWVKGGALDPPGPEQIVYGANRAFGGGVRQNLTFEEKAQKAQPPNGFAHH